MHKGMCNGKIGEESNAVGGACGHIGRRPPTKDEIRAPGKWKVERKTTPEVA